MLYPNSIQTYVSLLHVSYAPDAVRSERSALCCSACVARLVHPGRRLAHKAYMTHSPQQSEHDFYTIMLGRCRTACALSPPGSIHDSSSYM